MYEISNIYQIRRIHKSFSSKIKYQNQAKSNQRKTYAKCGKKRIERQNQAKYSQTK